MHLWYHNLCTLGSIVATFDARPLPFQQLGIHFVTCLLKSQLGYAKSYAVLNVITIGKNSNNYYVCAL